MTAAPVQGEDGLVLHQHDARGVHRITLYKAMREAQSRGLLSFDKNSDEIVILQPKTFFYEAHGHVPNVKY